MSIIRSAILLTASLLLAGCNVHTKPIEADAPARDAVASSASPCNGATDETLMGITEHANGLASICRLDGQGDCLYTEAFGKTFISSRPDFNGDDYVDVTDLAHFQFCASGANETPPAGCTDADLDDDGDVDQSDFGLFQRCLSGVEVVNPGC